MDFSWINNGQNTRKRSLLEHSSSQLNSPLRSANDMNNKQQKNPRVYFTDSLNPSRRSRADTMPSQSSTFPYISDTEPVSQESKSFSRRLRSGSVVISAEDYELSNYASSSFGLTYPYDLSSPIDENATKTIVSTLASLGLDDEHNASENNNETEEERTNDTTNNPINNSSNNINNNINNNISNISNINTLHSTINHPIDQSNTTHSHYSHINRARSYTVTAPAFDDYPSRLVDSFNPFTMDSASALHRQRAISLGMADLDMSNVFSPFDTSHSPIQSYQSTRYRMQHDQLPMMTSLSSNNIAETFHQQEEMDQDIPDSPTSAELQIPSRALWLGNINPSVSVPDLIQIFSAYGQVDSARILSDKECAFVNFTSIKSAVVAKTDLETRLGSKLVGNPVRVGYGKADVNVAMALSNEAGPNAQGPTRALWVGNIPANMNPNILRAIFQQYGPIDSIRVLSHKNCGFVNFIYQEDAVRARKNLQNKEILGPGTGTVRIGFARAPDESDEANPPTEPFTQMTAAQFNKLIGLNVSPHPSSETISPSNPVSVPSSSSNESQSEPTLLDNQSIVYTTQASERLSIMRELGYEPSEQLKVNRVPIHYYPVIPAVPEISTVEGNMEPFHLRELRKRLENAGDYLMEEVQSIVTECLPMIVELCSDYIGNTIIQKLFEYGSEQQRLSMLKKIAPYLASIGVHKNGTWAAQKIIDFANTPDLIQLVNQHIAPYVPLLLLDQFGNYVVQCCLRKGSHDNQYIFDAIVDKCWEIGQGRFGARAIRAILDNNLTTTEQRVYISSAIVQNIVLLTTNANGVLLVTWLLDSSELPNRYRVTCPRLSPYLSKLSLHKLGSMTLSKIVHQTEEPNASALIMNSLSDKSKAEIAKR